MDFTLMSLALELFLGLIVQLWNNFSLPWFIAINAWCWRADCEVLIIEGEVGVN